MFSDNKKIIEKALNLLVDIYIGLKDPISMLTLPLQAKIENKSR